MVLRRDAVSVSIAMHYQDLRFVPDVCVVVCRYVVLVDDL